MRPTCTRADEWWRGKGVAKTHYRDRCGAWPHLQVGGLHHQTGPQELVLCLPFRCNPPTGGPNALKGCGDASMLHLWHLSAVRMGLKAHAVGGHGTLDDAPGVVAHVMGNLGSLCPQVCTGAALGSGRQEADDGAVLLCHGGAQVQDGPHTSPSRRDSLLNCGIIDSPIPLTFVIQTACLFLP